MKMDVEELAEMIDQAAWVARNLHGSARPDGYRGYWPDVVHEWESYGCNAAESPRMRPTARQIDLLARVSQIVSCAPVGARGLF